MKFSPCILWLNYFTTEDTKVYTKFTKTITHMRTFFYYFCFLNSNIKQMKKILLPVIFILTVVFSGNLFAQPYKTTFGPRLGLANGLSVKHFLTDRKAVEGILTERWKGFAITGLYETHGLINEDVETLLWYYGFGAHVGFWHGYDNHPWIHDGGQYNVVGADLIIGAEYTFTGNLDWLTLALDWKPVFNIIGYSGFWGDEGGLTVRLNFKNF